MLHGLACIKTFFTDWNISALILDSAHDATAVYEMCSKNSITPFIDLNPRGTKSAEDKPRAGFPAPLILVAANGS